MTNNQSITSESGLVFPWSNSRDSHHLNDPEFQAATPPVLSDEPGPFSLAVHGLQVKLLEALSRKHRHHDYRQTLHMAMATADKADQLEKQISTSKDPKMAQLLQLRAKSVALAPHTKLFWQRLGEALCASSSRAVLLSGYRITAADCKQLGQWSFKVKPETVRPKCPKASPVNTPAKVVTGFKPTGQTVAPPSPNQPLRPVLK